MGSLQFGGSRYDLSSRLLSCRALTSKENHRQKRIIKVFMFGVIWGLVIVCTVENTYKWCGRRSGL